LAIVKMMLGNLSQVRHNALWSRASAEKISRRGNGKKTEK